MAEGWGDCRTHYFDPVTIRKYGNLRSVWELEDLKQRDKQGVMLRRSLFEYDCKKERSRLLSFSSHSELETKDTGYSEPMAGGNVL